MKNHIKSFTFCNVVFVQLLGHIKCRYVSFEDNLSMILRQRDHTDDVVAIELTFIASKFLIAVIRKFRCFISS